MGGGVTPGRCSCTPGPGHPRSACGWPDAQLARRGEGTGTPLAHSTPAAKSPEAQSGLCLARGCSGWLAGARDAVVETPKTSPKSQAGVSAGGGRAPGCALCQPSHRGVRILHPGLCKSESEGSGCARGPGCGRGVVPARDWLLHGRWRGRGRAKDARRQLLARSGSRGPGHGAGSGGGGSGGGSTASKARGSEDAAGCGRCTALQPAESPARQPAAHWVRLRPAPRMRPVPPFKGPAHPRLALGRPQIFPPSPHSSTTTTSVCLVKPQGHLGFFLGRLSLSEVSKAEAYKSWKMLVLSTWDPWNSDLGFLYLGMGWGFK